jgi:ABC-type methionine transport system permease subunit
MWLLTDWLIIGVITSIILCILNPDDIKNHNFAFVAFFVVIDILIGPLFLIYIIAMIIVTLLFGDISKDDE